MPFVNQSGVGVIQILKYYCTHTHILLLYISKSRDKYIYIYVYAHTFTYKYLLSTGVACALPMGR